MSPAVANEGDTLTPMFAGASASGIVPPWQRLLAEAITDPAELWRVLALSDEILPGAMAAARSFPLLVPRGFVALMTPGDPADPLLRQVLPMAAENEDVSGFTIDPLAESDCSPAPGLLRKYDGRALLVVTGACAVHCRYCFRRHFAYADLPRGRRWWTQAIDHLAADPGIEEIILSGGDPLTLPDAQLAALARDLADIPHLKRLRIHTRLPVVLPERVTGDLLEWFARPGGMQPVLVIHSNHARELSPAVAAACTRLRGAGVMLLNQSVLLRGVNDDATALVDLSRRLFAIGVQPYYLHCLDRVGGAAHFLVDDLRARELIRTMAARISGYLVPRLVREVPGASGKIPLAW